MPSNRPQSIPDDHRCAVSCASVRFDAIVPPAKNSMPDKRPALPNTAALLKIGWPMPLTSFLVRW